MSKILRNTIETNGLTLCIAILDALLFALFPQASWHVIPNLALVKLYFNSVLVSLNSRRRVAPLARVDEWEAAGGGGHQHWRGEGSGGSNETRVERDRREREKAKQGVQGVQGVQIVTQ